MSNFFSHLRDPVKRDGIGGGGDIAIVSTHQSHAQSSMRSSNWNVQPTQNFTTEPKG